jgi:hypothetical protein
VLEWKGPKVENSQVSEKHFFIGFIEESGSGKTNRILRCTFAPAMQPPQRNVAMGRENLVSHFRVGKGDELVKIGATFLISLRFLSLRGLLHQFQIPADAGLGLSGLLKR